MVTSQYKSGSYDSYDAWDHNKIHVQMGVESSVGAQIKEHMHPAHFHNDQPTKSSAY